MHHAPEAYIKVGQARRIQSGNRLNLRFSSPCRPWQRSDGQGGVKLQKTAAHLQLVYLSVVESGQRRGCEKRSVAVAVAQVALP